MNSRSERTAGKEQQWLRQEGIRALGQDQPCGQRAPEEMRDGRTGYQKRWHKSSFPNAHDGVRNPSAKYLALVWVGAEKSQNKHGQ